MNSAFSFTFAGNSLIADPAGVLYWPAQETLVVSDLHLEKGSSAAQTRARHVPPYDTRATLAALAETLQRYAPRRVICLGDSFHDDRAHGRMNDDDCAALIALTKAREWIWVAGNHDPAPPDCFGGRVEFSLAFGRMTLLHKAANRDGFEVSGHYHPKAAIVVRNSRVSGRCFVIDDTRLIMPAFGAYTGGLNVLDPALAEILSPDFSVALIGRHRVVRLPRRKLVA